MKCLECGDKAEAKLPEDDPTFCSQNCAFNFAVRLAGYNYGKCEEHGKWFDVELGCKVCEDDQSLAKMKEQRDALTRRIEDIESGKCTP
jgi:hypothetical protein